MPQANFTQEGRSAGAYPAHVTAMALRTAGQLYDMQMSAARVLMQTQARTAAILGWPDCSRFFNGAEEQTRNVFSTAAEQMLQTARRTGDTVAEIQQQFGRAVESQASGVADTWAASLEQIGEQTQEGLEQLLQTTREQAEEAQKVSESLTNATRETLQQGGERLREQMQAGAEKSRETLRQAGQAARETGEHAASEAQSATKEEGRRKAA